MNPASDQITGVWTAMITPFHENGSPDLQAMEHLLQAQIDGGIQGVVLCGSTGEASTLSIQEKLSLIRMAKARYGDQLKIMAGTGGQSTTQSVELSKLATDAGADALLVVTPPYSKPNLSGLLAHFQAVAEASKVPVCLYHVPGRTAQKLSVEALVSLCNIAGITCVKEASADLELFSAARSRCQATFLSGDDATFLPSMAVGGSGCISVISNIFPRAMQALYLAYQSGNTGKALHLHETMLPLMQAMSWETNPVPVKTVLAEAGLCKNIFRLPLAPATARHQQELTELTNMVKARLTEA